MCLNNPWYLNATWQKCVWCLQVRLWLSTWTTPEHLSCRSRELCDLQQHRWQVWNRQEVSNIHVDYYCYYYYYHHHQNMTREDKDEDVLTLTISKLLKFSLISYFCSCGRPSVSCRWSDKLSDHIFDISFFSSIRNEDNGTGERLVVTTTMTRKP